MRIIRLTELMQGYEEFIYLSVDKIVYFQKNNGGSYVKTTTTDFITKESPSEILQKITC